MSFSFKINLIRKFKNFIGTANRKRLIGNFLSLSILRGFQLFVPLITLPYLLRTIGIENFGLVNFALSLALYFGTVIQFGFGITATREIARYRDDPVKLAQIYSVTLTSSLILAAISSMLFALIVLSIEKFSAYLYLYLFTLALVVFQSLLPIWFFQGMEKMKYITFLSLSTSVMYLFSLLIFVKQQDDFILVPLLYAIAALITFILAIGLIHKQFNVKFSAPNCHEIKTIYREGYHSFIVQFAPNFYNNSTVFLLGLFTDNTLVGVYTAALRVLEAFLSLAQVLTNTFLPFFARGLSRHSLFLKIMGGTGLIATIAVILLSEVITKILYGDADDSIALYISMLAPWVVLIFLRNALGINYLMLIGYEKHYMKIILYCSSFSFGLALVLIPRFEILGAVLVINISALLMFVFTAKLYIKVKNEKN